MHVAGIGLILVVIAAPAVSFGQDVKGLVTASDSQPSVNWSHKFSVEAAPVFGSDRENAFIPQGDEIVDESELSAGLRFSRTTGPFELRIVPQAAFSPNEADEDLPQSALRLTVRLQEAHPLSHAEGTNGSELKVQDTRTPFIQYSVDAVFADFYGDRKHTDHKVAAGVRFENILNYLCVGTEGPLPDTTDGNSCTGEGGLRYVFSPSLEVTRSSNGDRDRITPKLTAELAWPVGIDFSVALDITAEARLYDSLRVSSGDLREDHRLSTTVSFNVGGWLRRRLNFPAGFEAGLGFRWVGVASNDPAKNSDQVFVVPNLRWSRRF